MQGSIQCGGGGGGQGEASPPNSSASLQNFKLLPCVLLWLYCSCDCIDLWAYSFSPRQKFLDRTLIMYIYIIHCLFLPRGLDDANLKQLVMWFLSQTGCPETDARHQCIKLFTVFAPPATSMD